METRIIDVTETDPRVMGTRFLLLLLQRKGFRTNKSGGLIYSRLKIKEVSFEVDVSY